jgi:hypothetical protein
MTKKHDDPTPYFEPKPKAHSSPHAGADDAASTPSANIFDLTPDLVAFVKTLTAIATNKIARLRKVPSDVRRALSDQVIQAIHDNPALGGPARAARITELLAQQGKLMAVNEVLVPLVQLVSNNLVAVNSELGDDVYEALKVAAALERSQPELTMAMQAAADWSRSYHPAHHAKPKTTSNKDKPTT